LRRHAYAFLTHGIGDFDRPLAGELELIVTNARPWFKAKSYGWGWGRALTWQGWVTYACYAGLLVGSAFFFPPHRDPALFVVCVTIWSAVLVAICLLKGEKPKWRWGR
jgi:hypothetical protein